MTWFAGCLQCFWFCFLISCLLPKDLFIFFPLSCFSILFCSEPLTGREYLLTGRGLGGWVIRSEKDRGKQGVLYYWCLIPRRDLRPLHFQNNSGGSLFHWRPYPRFPCMLPLIIEILKQVELSISFHGESWSFVNSGSM